MFFGAERRAVAARAAMPLRRSEPAAVAFLVAFGVAGYLLGRRDTLSGAIIAGLALLIGVIATVAGTRLAIAMARVTPEHDPDDPRFVLQGYTAVVSVPIPARGQGAITLPDEGAPRVVPARAIDDDAIAEGEEVCIERVDGGVAMVERWALVEQRL
jgi:membrane protein implicated in regulation of membrane protease activity